MKKITALVVAAVALIASSTAGAATDTTPRATEPIPLSQVAEYITAPSLEGLAATFEPDTAAWAYGETVLINATLVPAGTFDPAGRIEVVDGGRLAEVGADDDGWSEFVFADSGLVADFKRDGNLISDVTFAIGQEFRGSGLTLRVVAVRYVPSVDILVATAVVTNDGDAQEAAFFTDFVTAGRQLPDEGASFVQPRPTVTMGMVGAWTPVGAAGGTIYGWVGNNEFSFDVPPIGGVEQSAA